MMNIAKLSHYWADMLGDQAMLVFKGKTLSWKQFDEKTDCVASLLKQAGVGVGDRVGCLMNNSLEWPISYIAILKVGAILVPLNTRYGDAELQKIIAQVDLDAVVSTQEFIGKLGESQQQRYSGLNADEVYIYPLKRNQTPVSYGLIDSMADSVDRIDSCHVASRDDMAVICFTSGSSGLPKGAVYTHGSIYQCAISQINTLNLSTDERGLMLAPFAFTGGVISVFSLMYVAGACVYVEEGLKPESALQRLEQEKITFMTGVPILFESIAALPSFAQADLSAFRTSMTGGAPVSESLLRQYLNKGVTIRQTYGCTEGGGMVLIPSKALSIEHPETCGWPLPSIDFRLMNEKGELCAYDEVGEIQLKGAQVMQGYLNEEANKDAWNDGWLCTGDAAMMTEDGSVQIIGRQSNMIITGGVNVYPAEVECVLDNFNGVDEVLVVGQPDEKWGEAVVAILYGNSSIDLEDVLTQSRKLLGAYKSPRIIILSDMLLPRTTTGKVARNNIDELMQKLSTCRKVVRR